MLAFRASGFYASWDSCRLLYGIYEGSLVSKVSIDSTVLKLLKLLKLSKLLKLLKMGYWGSGWRVQNFGLEWFDCPGM